MDKINQSDIRARKITQLPDLDISDYENLYFALGYNIEGKVANYKLSLVELAQALVDTGLISTSSGLVKYLLLSSCHFFLILIVSLFCNLLVTFNSSTE